MPLPRFFRTAIFRLGAVNGIVFALCLLILLAASYVTSTAVLRDQIRSKIQDQIVELSYEARIDGTASIADDIGDRLKLYPRPADYYYLADQNGKKLAGNLDTLAIYGGWHETPLASIPSGPGADPSIEPDDHQLWGLGQRLPDGAFLFVGQDAYRVLSAQEAIIESFAWSAGIALLLAALASILVSRGFLNRIDSINTTSRAIIDGNLTERIPIRGTSDEIDRLSINLNELFDSNHALLESLKQVTTNIAHDLRTPLSRLRQGLEDAKLRSKDRKVYEDAVDAAIVESDQLLATFTALLRIAQIESGSRKTGFKRMSLSGVFERLAGAYRAVAEDQERPFAVTIAPGIDFVGDADLILQMIANLLENALQHTPQGTPVSMSLEQTPCGPIASIADDGPGIPAGHREKVFERFFRLDASRNTAGNGLGLALVSAIATLHGIGLTLKDNNPGLKAELNFAPQP